MSKYYFLVSVDAIYAKSIDEAEKILKNNLKNLKQVKIELDDVDED